MDQPDPERGKGQKMHAPDTIQEELKFSEITDTATVPVLNWFESSLFSEETFQTEMFMLSSPKRWKLFHDSIHEFLLEELKSESHKNPVASKSTISSLTCSKFFMILAWESPRADRIHILKNKSKQEVGTPTLRKKGRREWGRGDTALLENLIHNDARQNVKNFGRCDTTT